MFPLLTGSCDVAEYCDGSSSACPVDDSVGNGAACNTTHGNGACYGGQCKTAGAQCSVINAASGPWIPCTQVEFQRNFKPEDFCKNLTCYSTTPNSCLKFTFTNGLSVLTEDGTPCGFPYSSSRSANTASLCYAGACVSAEVTN